MNTPHSDAAPTDAPPAGKAARDRGRESVLHPAAECLLLRVRGGARDGQLLRIRSSKCTIGSDARCSLRLTGRGIQPVHCLIVRGRRRTVLRRWSADTRLNGLAFDDATLETGDRLGIGPIEFEVLPADEAADFPLESQAVAPAEDSPDQSRRELQQEHLQWDEQRRRAQADLDRREALLEEQRIGLSADRQALDRQRQDSADVARQCHEQRSQLIADQEQLQRSLAESGRKTAALEAESEVLARNRREIDDLRAEVEARRASLEDQFQERIQAGLDECERRSKALDEDRLALKNERESLDRDRRALNQARQALEAELAAWEEQFAQRDDKPAAARAQLTEGVATSTQSDASGLSTARFLPQSDDREAYTKPSSGATAEPPPPPGAQDDDDDSVEAYMRRLMLRNSGGSPDAESARRVPPASEPRAQARPSPTEKASRPPAATTPRDAADDDASAPPAAAPRARWKSSELTKDLAAMRDLANMSARRAIAKHQLRTDKYSMRMFLLLSTVSISGGLYLYMTAQSTSAVSSMAGLGAVCVGLYFLVQFAAGWRSRKRAMAMARSATVGNQPQPTDSPDSASDADAAATGP